MLRLGKMADYGIVVMTALINESMQSQNASEIAAAIPLPLPTVSKILKMLARGGLVVSLRGPKGGYSLAHPADKISLVDIIRIMDGPIGMTECSVTPGLCTQESGCIVRANWQRINQAVLGVLQKITLDQMIAPVTQTIDDSALKGRRVSRPRAAARDLK